MGLRRYKKKLGISGSFNLKVGVNSIRLDNGIGVFWSYTILLNKEIEGKIKIIIKGG